MPKSEKSPQDKLKRQFKYLRNRFILGQVRTVGEALDILGIVAESYGTAEAYGLFELGGIEASLNKEKLDFLLNKVEEVYSPPPKKIEKQSYGQFYREFKKSLRFSRLALPPTEEVPRSAIHNLVQPLLPKRSQFQIAILKYFQQNAGEEIFWKIVKENLRGIQLRANTGDGKTYCLGQIIRWLIDKGDFFSAPYTFSPYPILYVTKASIVEQSKDDLKRQFGLDLVRQVLVTNYDSLRAFAGRIFVEEEVSIQGGEEVFEWKWKPILNPRLIIWDENQALKNPSSQQRKIADAFNNLEDPHTVQIFSSATPWSRVIHAQTFCVATRIPFSGLLGTRPLSNISWPMFAQSFVKDASKESPEQYSKAMIRRLLKKMSPYIVGFKNVRRKHKATNITEFIDFETEKDRESYNNAWERYLEQKAKIESSGSPYGGMLILAQFTVFCHAAEILRYRILARRMHEEYSRGLAPIAACRFKTTIAKVVNHLYQDYNIPRSKISLIWGGESAFQTEGKYSKEDIQRVFRLMMQGEDIDRKVIKEIKRQLIYEGAGLNDLPPELELGVQSREQRWKEIKRFQSGKSEFCFFTFGAGGAGLSLHHNSIDTRQRRTFITPTWNEMDLEQSLGRAPRLTSLSDTLQTILLFRGTIEERVLAVMNAKRTCLTEVVKYSEKTATAFIDKDLRDLMEVAGIKVEDEEEEELTERDYEEIEKEEEE